MARASESSFDNSGSEFKGADNHELEQEVEEGQSLEERGYVFFFSFRFFIFSLSLSLF